MNSVYIAMSLDGFIADENGSIEWLNPFNEQLAKSSGYFSTRYASYYHDVTSVVMGYKTYETIKGFDIEWPYKGKETILISTKTTASDPEINTWSTLEHFIKTPRPGKTWIVGGGQIVSQLLSMNCVDELIITIMPILLGHGIPLFINAKSDSLICTHNMLEDGIVEVTYRKN